MRNSVVSRAAAAVAAGVFVATQGAFAEPELGSVAAGGVMRDAERRVASASVAALGKDAAEASAPSAPAVAAPPSQGRVIGAVEKVKAVGAEEFAASERVAESLEAALAGGEKTDADLVAAIASVRNALIGKGYYLARVIVPEGAYDAASKTLTVVVDEGRVGEVSVKFADGSDDGTWYSREQIMSRLRRVGSGSPFNYNALRGAVAVANAHPDLTLDAAVSVRKTKEGEGAEARTARYADLAFTVDESIPFHAAWEINNHGMKEIDEWQTSLTLQYLNLTKHDDSLTVSPAVSMNGDLVSVAAAYNLPHDWLLGGSTAVYGGYSRLDADDVIPRLDLEGTGWFAGIVHTENVYDGDVHRLSVSAGILWRYLEDRYTAYGRYKLNERGAAILPFSLSIDYAAKATDALGGRNFASLQGVVNVANAYDDLGEVWSGADEHYWLLRWQVARLQQLTGDLSANRAVDQREWTLFAKVEGQYTDDTLIPVEKLALGGADALRGYRTKGYLGDRGVYGTVEIRTPVLDDFVSSLFGDWEAESFIDRVQFLGFFDWGYLAYNGMPSGYDNDEFLYSVGLGMRVALTKYTEFKCDLAVPLRDTDWADDDDLEVYMSLKVQF